MSTQEHTAVTTHAPSVVQIETSKLMPMLIVLSILSGLSLAASLLTFLYAKNAETESRMLEYYVLELDAKLIASGIKKPEEAVASRLKEK